MMTIYYNLIWRLALLHFISAEKINQAPNIILVVADDLGWNDVSWHNPNIHTPNLEKLAREGVILNQHYVLPTCTPTRAALLTGRYPYKLGIQRNAIRHLEPDGLPLGLTTLAEELKARNYSTHAFGKWHLGYCNWSLTPTHRGFDTFRGYYLGSQDYFKHTVSERRGSIKVSGYDYRKDNDVDWSAKGIYSTNLTAKNVWKIIEEKSKEDRPVFLYVAFQSVHAPLHTVPDYEGHCSLHNHSKRVKICEMAAAMDHAVGLIVDKLKETHMWNNSILVFMSDNGAQVRYGGNNWPLRGNKNTLYEGGTRVPAFVTGPLLQRTNYTSSSIMHVVDWFPTLVSATGLNSTLDDIDGVDHWSVIRDGTGDAPRTEFIYNLDRKDGGLFGAIRDGDMKLLLKPQKKFSSWYNESEEHPENVKFDWNAPELLLYNITADPYETNDLSTTFYEVAERLKCQLLKQVPLMIASQDMKDDPKGDPRLQKPKGVYGPGWCKAPVWRKPDTEATAPSCHGNMTDD